jgi:hypothetical protein
MPDGSSTVVKTRPGVISINPPVPRLDGLRTVGAGQRPPWFAAEVPIEISLVQRQAIAAGQARLSLQGLLEVRELRAGEELPLRAGAAAADGGRRIRITSAESLAEGPAVEVRTSEVASRSAEDTNASGAEYLLVNRDRAEALEMHTRGSSSTEFALVLPGPGARISTDELHHGVQRPDAPPIGPEWLRGARLLLVRWVPVGSDPIAAVDRGRGFEEWAAEDSRSGRGR